MVATRAHEQGPSWRFTLEGSGQVLPLCKYLEEGREVMVKDRLFFWYYRVHNHYWKYCMWPTPSPYISTQVRVLSVNY